ncbi:MAG: mammalian cell entry protein, partial [Mycobacterium sp.]
MTARIALRRALTLGCCVALTVSGCAFHGLNSLPLPGAVGRGPGADIYHVEMANVVTMESNSPVMINDVVIDSVGPMKVKDWHADVEISV